MNNKKKIILSILVVLLLLAIGVAYAFFTYENGTKSEIVTGQIYMNYEETSTISLTGVFPETKEQALARTDNNGVFEFTITGRNTSQNTIYYEIDLLEGGLITGATSTSTKISPEHVMIYLEKDGKVVVDGVSYSDWNNKRIYVDTVPANQTTNIEHKYTLRMWLDSNITISDTDPNADYTTSEWNNSYTSLKVRVVGDFEEKKLEETPSSETAVDKIVAQLGTNGLVAVATDGTLYTDSSTQTIREYRYSGSNDVVKNNYVSFNGDLWRIIGVFPTKTDTGTTENLIKIIKATPLTAEEIPTNYTYNGVEMMLKYIDTSSNAYWNREAYFNQTNMNDWTQASLQYFLNDEISGSASYYDSINPSYQSMIQKSVYNLGNVTPGDTNTPSNSYNEERSANIHDGNKETWIGNIGLMYPSDYGYASNSTYWNISMWDYSLSKNYYGWLYKSDTNLWTISPSNGSGFTPMGVYGAYGGHVYSNDEYGTRDWSTAVAPVLYLKSDVMISGGEGTSLVPYQLSFE